MDLGRLRLFVLVLLLPRAAAAWPVDVYVDVAAGEDKFIRFEAVDWVELEDPKVATAEAFDSGEVLITGLTPGRTLLLVYGQGRFSVWRITVAAKGARPPPATAPDLAPLRTVCPGAKLEGKALAVKVASDKCRLALRTHPQGDHYRAEELDLTFELEALQSQLQDIGRGIAALGLLDKVTARYLGAGLILSGKLSEAEHRRLLWEIFRRSTGRAPLEDQIEVVRPTATDAGIAPRDQ